MSKTRVLVTGATGAIGPILVKHLLKNNYDVKILIRSSKSPKKSLPDNIKEIIGDITDYNILRDAVKDVEIVFHLAAKLHINNPDASLFDQYENINVKGTKNLVQAAKCAKVKRIVFFSTIAVYGKTNFSNILDETFPADPNTIYANTKYKAESIVLNATCENGRPIGVVLRAAAVYGGSVKGNYLRLIQWIGKGLFVPIGNGNNRRTLIYDKDLVKAALLSACHPNAPGKIYNVTDGHIYRFQNIIDAIYQAHHKTCPKFYIPLRPILILSKIFDYFLDKIGIKVLSPLKIVEKISEDMAVSGLKIQKELGFKPCFKFYSAWKEAVISIKNRSLES